MINAILRHNESGVLLSFEASGHAGFAKKGKDIVCSAVSILFRTAVSVLEKCDDVKLEVNAKERGFLKVEIAKIDEAENLSEKTKEKLEFLSEFLTEGLQSIEDEYPDCIKLVKFEY